MLLSITPNPTIDRSLSVPHLRVAEVQRAEKVHLAAGGKGLNVFRAAQVLDLQVLVTGPLAGATGNQIAELAKSEGICCDWFRLKRGESRNCLLVHHATGDSTVINEPGPSVDGEEWFSFVDHCLHLAKSSLAVCICGSFPPDLPEGSPAHMASTLSSVGVPVLVDTSSSALRDILGGESIVKVNRTELANALHWQGQRDDWSGLFAAYLNLAGSRAKDESRVRPLIVTLGKEGAVWLSREGFWKAVPPSVSVVSSVGSGDAFMAGIAAALFQQLAPDDLLRWGVAAGTANLPSELPARFGAKAFVDLLPSVTVSRIRE